MLVWPAADGALKRAGGVLWYLYAQGLADIPPAPPIHTINEPPMIELTGEVPFLWRLCANEDKGSYSVAMVVPGPDDSESFDLTIETGILRLTADPEASGNEEILEWNQNDLDLFLRLINQRKIGRITDQPDTVRLDLTDPEVIEIIHIVAAAGFGFPYLPIGVLKDASGEFPRFDAVVGSPASLNTVSGFKPCVVVEVAEEEVACVLLDDLPVEDGEGEESLCRNDLLVVGRTDLLHPSFAQTGGRPESATIH